MLRLLYLPTQLLAIIGLLIIFTGGKSIIILIEPLIGSPELSGYVLETNDSVPTVSLKLKTPEHIAPLWYFSPSYSVLRSVPDKLFGLIAMYITLLLVPSIILIFIVFTVLQYVHRNRVNYFQNINHLVIATLFLVFSIVGLGITGSIASTTSILLISKILSVLYFSYFLLVPLYITVGKSKVR